MSNSRATLNCVLNQLADVFTATRAIEEKARQSPHYVKKFRRKNI